MRLAALACRAPSARGAYLASRASVWVGKRCAHVVSSDRRVTAGLLSVHVPFFD